MFRIEERRGEERRGEELGERDGERGVIVPIHQSLCEMGNQKEKFFA